MTFITDFSSENETHEYTVHTYIWHVVQSTYKHANTCIQGHRHGRLIPLTYTAMDEIGSQDSHVQSFACAISMLLHSSCICKAPLKTEFPSRYIRLVIICCDQDFTIGLYGSICRHARGAFFWPLACKFSFRFPVDCLFGLCCVTARRFSVYHFRCASLFFFSCRRQVIEYLWRGATGLWNRGYGHYGNLAPGVSDR